MKELKMRPQWKRGILIAAVLMFVGAAAWLNWSYNQRWGEADSAMSDAEDEMTAAVNAMLGTSREAAEPALSTPVSDYFAKARLTRQQSRDQALSLLETAASAETASQEVIDAAMNEITVMAGQSLLESKIENELLAKSFADCVVYLTDDSCMVAVPAPTEGLAETDVARITDAVMANSQLTAAQINVIEVMDY
ncbi:MAG: SpoIIIAH-like family protein [Oscillospiraceae bacterium]|nr:SpoIIIAH-like family protein [Oscillospiraceae bacterium]